MNILTLSTPQDVKGSKPKLFSLPHVPRFPSAVAMDTPSEHNKQVAVRPNPGAVALPGQFKRPKPVKKVLEEEEFTDVRQSSPSLTKI